MMSVSDLSALCWLFPMEDRPGYQALWRFWAPEERLEDLDRRTAGAAHRADNSDRPERHPGSHEAEEHHDPTGPRDGGHHQV